MSAAPKANELLMRSVRPLDHTIEIRAKITDTRSSINFLVNDDPNNIGFHFNPRFDQKCVVLNNMENGVWRTEQRGCYGDKFPFVKDQEVKFQFKTNNEGIAVKANGGNLFWREDAGTSVKHRVAANSLSGILIRGMQVESVSIYEERNGDASNEPTLLSLDDLPSLGQTYVIVGRLVETRASVNLLVNNDDANIGYHFNPRLDQRCVVLNNMENNVWKTEQRGSLNEKFLFLKNANVTLVIHVTKEGISVLCNGVELTDCFYQHRVDPATLSGFRIRGMSVSYFNVEREEGADRKVSPFSMDGLKPFGKTLILTARMIDERFSVNFLVKDDRKDIAYHFNPRFAEKLVVLNNKENDGWRTEQRGCQGDEFPFVHGDKVELKFVVDKEGITSWHRATELKDLYYKNRVDPETLCGLFLEGLEVESLKVIGDQDHKTYNDYNKHQIRLHKQEFIGRKLVLVGEAFKQRPEVNFLTGDSDHDTALHFNPRFDLRVLVQNSKVEGVWQQETPHMPLPPGAREFQELRLEFHVLNSEIESLIDGRLVGNFPHRVATKDLIGLNVVGIKPRLISIS